MSPRPGRPPQYPGRSRRGGPERLPSLELGLPAFQAKRLHAVLRSAIADPRQMTDLPAAVRDRIARSDVPDNTASADITPCRPDSTLAGRRRYHVRIGADALSAAQHGLHFLAGRLRHLARSVPLARAD